MARLTHHTRLCGLLIGALLSTLAVARAQQGPVAAMFSDDQKRGEAIALSFATAECRRRRGSVPRADLSHWW